MPKEINVRPGVGEEWVDALAALPDPGVGKRLIVFVSASSVRLRVIEDEATIQEQERKAGGEDE